MEKDNTTKHYIIYIIESPSSLDILNNIEEGETLSKVLKLSGIESYYFPVTDKLSFIETFNRIGIHYRQSIENKGFLIPCIHFSMHGNSNGLVLTNKETLYWQDIYDSLKHFHKSIGQNEKEVFLTHLLFSSCYGINAKKIDLCGKISQYTALVGPAKEVSWPESLVAFQVFYFNFIYKNLGGDIAIRNMNISTNNNFIYKVHCSKDFEKMILEKKAT